MPELKWALGACAAALAVFFVVHFLPTVEKLTIDGGNALVGLGTVFVALTSLQIAGRRSALEEKKLHQQIIDDRRAEFSHIIVKFLTQMNQVSLMSRRIYSSPESESARMLADRGDFIAREAMQTFYSMVLFLGSEKEGDKLLTIMDKYLMDCLKEEHKRQQGLKEEFIQLSLNVLAQLKIS